MVLADSEAASEDGSQVVEVEYESFAPAIDPLLALRPDALVVRARANATDEELGMHGASADGSTSQAPQAPNVAKRTRFQRGDVDRALAEADVVVTREYRTPWVHGRPGPCISRVSTRARLSVRARRCNHGCSIGVPRLGRAGGSVCRP